MPTTKTLAAAIKAANTHTDLFDYEGYRQGSLADAARNQLDGLSHYFDTSTLRFFGAKVLHLETLADGLILGAIESVQPPSGPKLYRAVFFDLFGNVVSRTTEETEGFTGVPTLAKARKLFSSVAADTDWHALTVKAIEKHAKSLQDQSQEFLDAIKAP